MTLLSGSLERTGFALGAFSHLWLLLGLLGWYRPAGITSTRQNSSSWKVGSRFCRASFTLSRWRGRCFTSGDCSCRGRWQARSRSRSTASSRPGRSLNWLGARGGCWVGRASTALTHDLASRCGTVIYQNPQAVFVTSVLLEQREASAASIISLARCNRPDNHPDPSRPREEAANLFMSLQPDGVRVGRLGRSGRSPAASPSDRRAASPRADGSAALSLGQLLESF